MIIDKEVSKNVIKIFNDIIEGKTASEIAVELNKNNALTPYAYKMKNDNIAIDKKWNAKMINVILQNRVYYHCTSYVRDGSCTSHSIRKDKLTEIVLEELNKKFKRNKINTITRDILLKNVDSIIISQNGGVTIKFK